MKHHPFFRVVTILAAVLLVGLGSTSCSRSSTLAPANANQLVEIAVTQQLEGAVVALAYSPDGSQLVFGDMGGSIHVWDVRGLEEAKVLEGPSGGLSDLVLSADGTTTIAITPNWNEEADFHKLRLWKLKGYAELPAPANFGQDETADVSAASALAISPDGTQLALDTCSGNVHLSLDGGVQCDSMGVRLVDITTGASRVDLTETIGAGAWSLAFNPAGTLLVVCGKNGIARLLDIEHAAVKSTLIESAHHTIDATFSPDGQTVAVAVGTGIVHVFDVATGKQIAQLEGHTGAVTSVAFSPDGDLLVSGSTDKTVRVWDVTSGELLATLSGHQDAVFAIAFSPDGTQFASGGNDRTVRFWGLPR